MLAHPNVPRSGSKEAKEITFKQSLSPRSSPRNSLSVSPQASHEIASFLRGKRKRSVLVKEDGAMDLNSEYSGDNGPTVSRAMSIATLNSDMEEPSSISYLDNVLRYEFQRAPEHAKEGSEGLNDASDKRTLLRSPSWRPLAQAEADEMAPTVWTADGLEKKPVAADRERGPIAQFCENLQNKRAWTAAYVFFTAYALFSIDIDALAGDKSSKVGIAICTTFVALAFLLELIVHGMGKEGYIYSAFFILDLVAFISLIPDTIIFQIANDDNAFVAGRSSRLTRMLRLFGRSARAARLNRFGRIARIAALMPKIQELQRYWVHQVEDQDATRVLEKKIYRIFCFLDEDMDSYISKSALRLCRDKLFDLARIENSKKTEWTSKLRMLADAAASARISVPRVRPSTEQSNGGQTPVSTIVTIGASQLHGSESALNDSLQNTLDIPKQDTTHLALAIPNGLNKSTRADSKPFPDQVEYIEFRDSLMNEPPLYEWLKNSVVRQLKRGQNVQALRQRNAEYIGVKVAMAILIIILVLSYVELLTEDTSLSWGFERLNAYVKLTIGAPEFNSTIPMAIRRQVITWGKQNEWGRPDRPLLYLDLQRQVYCNSLRPNGVSCSSPLSETTLWQQRKTLNEVDQDVSASPYRTSDLLLLRYPEFSQQDVDISAEELENQTEAVALFLNRVDTQASARDSIFTTWGVLLLIMGGITLLTRDLNYLSKNLLKPLVELSDEVESITRLQLAATTNADDENQPATSEIRLLRRRFNGMKTAIRSWGKYVPWPVVQLMMRKDAEANIEVSERQVTMFFSDIASFTTIVESIPPEKSLLMLSRYFQEMSKIVDQHGGIVVEFIGDAILCIYGAPVVNDKHATVAVMAAAEMLAAMTGINQWLTRRDLPKIAIRCGIHTGEVLVGNMGMQYRIKYGIVGDECSMPGRLEELNKTYGTQLLVSESTHSDMEIDGFVSRPIDFIRGSEETHDKESQQIFEVWKSNKKQSKAALEEKAADLYTEAVQHYRHKRFSEAKDGFTQAGKAMHKLTGTQDVASALMLKRCLSYMEKPPPDNWDGVWDRGN